MICKNCGKTYADGSTFCPSCGAGRTESGLKVSGSKASGSSAFKKAGSVPGSGFGKMMPPSSGGWKMPDPAPRAPESPNPYGGRPRTVSDWPTPPAPGYYGGRETGGYAGGGAGVSTAPAPKKKFMWWIPVVCGAAVIALVAVLLVFLLNTGYEKPIETLVSGVMMGDTDKIVSVIAPEVQGKYAVYDVDTFLYDCEGMIAESVVEYKIVDAVRMSDSHISDLYGRYDYLCRKIEDAYELTVEVDVTVGRKTISFTVFPRTYNIGGEWYLDTVTFDDVLDNIEYSAQSWKDFKQYCKDTYPNEWRALKDFVD